MLKAVAVVLLLFSVVSIPISIVGEIYLSRRVFGNSRAEMFGGTFEDSFIFSDLFSKRIGQLAEYIELKNILETEGLSGTLSWQKAAKQIQEQIDSDILVPFLLLYHKNYALKDFQWHWFNLAGYEIFDTEFYVKAVTYGNFWWLNLQELWNTGYRKKGGIIHIFFIEN